MVKEGLKLLIITFIMGITYLLIELLYKGNSSWQLILIGGFAGMLIGLINKVFTWKTPLILQGLIGMFIATTCEFTGGLIFNSNYVLWDYRRLPFNFHGQICLYFMFAWYGISLFGIFWDDFLRWKLFGEDKPRYKIF